MNGLPYYKAYPRDFIEGTIGMPLELKGAYRLLLDLVYLCGGDLPDDPRYIAGHLGCTLRKWDSIRSKLISMDKIQVEGGSISNYRAVIELETLRKLQDKQTINASGPRKNKDLRKAMAKPKPSHTDTDTEKESKANALPKKIGSRLSGDWFLPVTWGEWALAEGLAIEAIRVEADKFRDYWISKPGQDGVKLDWQATWRNWIRNNKTRLSTATRNNGGKHDQRSFNLASERIAAGLADGSINYDFTDRDPFAAR